MEITEVRIKLMEDSDDRLQAFCSITFDNCFVVRDLKIIEGANGAFVAMPSRKLTSHCSSCGAKNHLRAAHCNSCGARLRDGRASRDSDGRAKLYADIAHPINSQCREMIQDRVISEFEAELVRSQQPGYVSRYDEDYGDAGPEDSDDHSPRHSGRKRESRATEEQSSASPERDQPSGEVRRIDEASELPRPHRSESPGRTASVPSQTTDGLTEQGGPSDAPSRPVEPEPPGGSEQPPVAKEDPPGAVRGKLWRRNL